MVSATSASLRLCVIALMAWHIDGKAWFLSERDFVKQDVSR